MKGFFISGLIAGPLVFSQVSGDSITMGESRIEAIEFTRRLPVTKEVLNVSADLQDKNLGQDLPVLLKNQTSVIATSDAGNGIGYTSLRIRGVSPGSINVMLNGVPYNDSESQGTFFVNVPDLTSSAGQIVIQRGVGTSTNGVAAFGASVNILTKDPSPAPYVRGENSLGSFNTQKYALEIGSGTFLKKRFSVMGRFSKIQSDGYIDRASSNLNSYNLTSMYKHNKTLVRLMVFGGKEKTYQAWNGVDRQTWEDNPRFNSAGAIYDDAWENIVDFYSNETDNYRQNHTHLTWKQLLSDQWNIETTLHHTRGKGYYENYKQDADYSKYNLTDYAGSSDFIRKKWLDNNFYGIVSNANASFSNVELQLGLVANQYSGWHYGRVNDVFVPEISEYEYYRNYSLKNEVSGYMKSIFHSDKFSWFGDLQVRSIDYSTRIDLEGDGEGGNINSYWTFFNPKFGVSYQLGIGRLYLSYAKAMREPNRDDLLSDPTTRAEKLHDFELGIEGRMNSSLIFAANVFHMFYRDQLVLSGAINDIGEFIRTNSGRSFRQGLEISSRFSLTERWEFLANATFSRNINVDFKSEEQSEIADLGRTPIAFSPESMANLKVTYKPNHQFRFSLSNQYVGKQYLDNTGNDALTTDAYLLNDFMAGYEVELNKIGLEINVLLNNIFDQKYVNNGYVYDGEPYYFAQAGRNFLLGVAVNFK